MLKRFKMKKKLIKTFERVKFKAENPTSKVYGHFKVTKIEDDNYETYKIANFKILNSKHKRELKFYENNVLQMEVFRFTSKYYNDIQSIEIAFKKTDDLTNNYSW